MPQEAWEALGCVTILWCVLGLLYLLSLALEASNSRHEREAARRRLNSLKGRGNV